MDTEESKCIPWEHEQAIKNQIFGPEFEAVEVYPKESRLTNEANCYWLWVLKNEEQFPFGFKDEDGSSEKVKFNKIIDMATTSSVAPSRMPLDLSVDILKA